MSDSAYGGFPPGANTAGNEPCPCGSGQASADCCGALIAGRRQAATAEELMRSRYVAFVVGAADHLFRTWHPATRPKQVDPGDLTWTGLQVLDTVDGGPGDSDGIVEFVAHYRAGRKPGRLHERSRFERRAGRWFYVDGEISGG